MEFLTALIDDLVKNSEVSRWVVVGMIAGAIFLVALALLFLVESFLDPERKRFYQVVGTKSASSPFGERLADSVRPITAYILPQKEAERSRVKERLMHAGYRSPSSLTVFYSVKLLLIISFPVAVLSIAPWFPNLPPNRIGFYALLAGFAGMILPSYFLDHKIAKRKRRLNNGFPDAIDLLVVCTEAGLGLNAALMRVAEEMTVSCPILAEELMILNAEIHTGVDRMQALKNLAVRTGLEEIKGLVSLLAQSLRFGTSIAETLRIYSEEFRDKRMQRAEEAAAKIGTKMIFPLVLCLFPGFFVAAIGPAAVKIFAAFATMNH